MQEIFIEDTPQNVAEKAVGILIDWIQQNPSQPKFNIALSGGSTPDLMFDILRVKNINWNKINLYWVDERCVAPNDPQSNYGRAYDLLISKIKIPQPNIHRMMGEENPVDEASRYQRLLSENLTFVHKIPSFDIVYLGMGNDGHTASIFPNDLSLLTSPNWVAVNQNPNNLQIRTTLTGTVINNARNVIFVATGKDKTEMIKNVVVEKQTKYPAIHIQPTHGKLWWIMDKEAGRLI